MNKPIIIADIGQNHNGNLETAKEMIRVLAHYCKVDYVKFQKRCPKELLTPEQYDKLYDNPNSFGKTYGEHREALEFTIDQHAELKAECEKQGIKYSCSVWDMTSAKEIASLNPDYIKIPSAINTNLGMIEWLVKNYTGQIHVGLGMTTFDEKVNIWNVIESRNPDFIPYLCTSSYPCEFKDIHLISLDISKFLARSDFLLDTSVTGFSGHHKGIAIDIAAYALGATWIERHFTLDRTQKGTDHACSLEPDGMRRLVRDLNATHQALAYKPKEILDCELEAREKMKWKPK